MRKTTHYHAHGKKHKCYDENKTLSKLSYELKNDCFTVPLPSMKLNYRVVVGKHNLKEAEPSAKAYYPTKIIIHRHYNPVLLSIG